MASTTDLKSTVPITTTLQGPNDWFEWYTQYRYHTHQRGVWPKINPNAIDIPHHSLNPPAAPTASATEINRQNYLIQTKTQTIKQSQYSTIQNQITKTVNSTILVGILTKLELLEPNQEPSIQRVLHQLKNQLAPSNLGVTNNIRTQYLKSLNKARSGGINPDTWLANQQQAYIQAKAKNIPKVQGQVRIQRFLETVGTRIVPSQAQQQLTQMARTKALSNNTLTLKQYGKWLTVKLRHAKIRSQLSRETGGFGSAFATLASQPESDSSSSHHYPCLGSPDHTHPQEPKRCFKLKYAIWNIQDKQLTNPPNNKSYKKIKARFQGNNQRQLRAKMKKPKSDRHIA